MNITGIARRWFLALVALALLACAQGCGESARPLGTPVASSTSAMA